MRVAGIVLTCGLVLAACSGGAASTSPAVPSEAAPSAAATVEPTAAPATVEPSTAAASVEPSASAAAENCMDARLQALLTNAETDWKTMSAEDREAVAAALEAYDFSEQGKPDYGSFAAALLRDLGSTPRFDSLLAGQITIVPCG